MLQLSWQTKPSRNGPGSKDDLLLGLAQKHKGIEARAPIDTMCRKRGKTHLFFAANVLLFSGLATHPYDILGATIGFVPCQGAESRPKCGVPMQYEFPKSFESYMYVGYV